MHNSLSQFIHHLRSIVWSRQMLLSLGLVSFLIPANYLFGPAESDATSYVSYSTSILFDQDLDFTNENVRGLNTFPNGQLRPVHAPGAAFAALPILAPFAALDAWTESEILHNRSAYPSSYISIGWRFAAIVALLLGVSALRRFMQRVGIPLSSTVILMSTVGSGIGGYFTFQTPESPHVFGFALFSVLALMSHSFYESLPGLRSLTLGVIVIVVAVLAALTRPENIIFVLLWLALLQVVTSLGPRHESNPNEDLVRSFVRFISVAVGTVLIWALANTSLYGIAIPMLNTRYSQSTLNVLQSGGLAGSGRLILVEVASLDVTRLKSVSGTLVGASFGPEVGVFYFAPVIFIAPLVGLLLFMRTRRRNRLAGLLILMAVLFSILIVAYWQSSGRGYGLRYAFNVVPFSLVGIGLLRAKVHAGNRRIAMLYKRFFIGWTALGIYAQFFADAIPGFYKTSHMPMYFPKSSTYIPNFLPNLLGTFYDPNAWAAVASARLPGFLAARVAPENFLEALFLRIFGSNGETKYTFAGALESINNVPATHASMGLIYILGAAYVFVSAVRPVKRAEEKV